jgi:hypothetical protein
MKNDPLEVLLVHRPKNYRIAIKRKTHWFVLDKYEFRHSSDANEWAIDNYKGRTDNWIVVKIKD